MGLGERRPQRLESLIISAIPRPTVDPIPAAMSPAFGDPMRLPVTEPMAPPTARPTGSISSETVATALPYLPATRSLATPSAHLLVDWRQVVAACFHGSLPFDGDVWPPPPCPPRPPL